MLLLKIVFLKRKDGEHSVHVTTNGMNAVFLPSPYFRRNIVENRTDAFFLDIGCNLEIETGIVHKNHRIGLPSGNFLFATLHATQNGRKMKQNGNEAHVGKVSVVTKQFPAGSFHFIAAVTAELCFGIFLLQRHHQMCGVEVSTGFTGNKKVLHVLSLFLFSNMKIISCVRFELDFRGQIFTRRRSIVVTM